ncbi:MAG: IS66 family insertion sequence element accessory protein TnpB [Pseudomonadota bacterium]
MGSWGLRREPSETRGSNGSLFHSERKDRIKILVLDQTGLLLAYKLLKGSQFHWPKLAEGAKTRSPAQISTLFEGLD